MRKITVREALDLAGPDTMVEISVDGRCRIGMAGSTILQPYLDRRVRSVVYSVQGDQIHIECWNKLLDD